MCNALHGGYFAILGGLTDEELEEVGLSSSKVREMIIDAWVADAARQQKVLSIWEASRSPNTEWLRLMEEMLDLDEAWRLALAAAWTLTSPYVDTAHLASGPLGSRANALLHIAAVDLTVSDIRETFVSMACEVAEGRVSAFTKGAMYFSSFAAGAVVGYVSGGAGVPLVTKAADWVGSKLTEPGGWELELTERWILASAFAQYDSERVTKIARMLYSEASELSRSSPGAAQSVRVKMLLSGYQSLMDLVREPDDFEGLVLPSLVGMRLSDAREALSALGVCSLELVDAFAPQGSDRFPMLESKWIVRGQSPTAETPISELVGPVRLAYARPDERVLEAVVRSRLED